MALTHKKIYNRKKKTRRRMQNKKHQKRSLKHKRRSLKPKKRSLKSKRRSLKSMNGGRKKMKDMSTLVSSGIYPYGPDDYNGYNGYVWGDYKSMLEEDNANNGNNIDTIKGNLTKYLLNIIESYREINDALSYISTSDFFNAISNIYLSPDDEEKKNYMTWWRSVKGKYIRLMNEGYSENKHEEFVKNYDKIIAFGDTKKTSWFSNNSNFITLQGETIFLFYKEILFTQYFFSDFAINLIGFENDFWRNMYYILNELEYEFSQHQFKSLSKEQKKSIEDYLKMEVDDRNDKKGKFNLYEKEKYILKQIKTDMIAFLEMWNIGRMDGTKKLRRLNKIYFYMFKYFYIYCNNKISNINTNYYKILALSILKDETKDVQDNKGLPELTAILNYYAYLIESQRIDKNQDHTYYLPWNFIKKCIEIIFKEEDLSKEKILKLCDYNVEEQEKEKDNYLGRDNYNKSMIYSIFCIYSRIYNSPNSITVEVNDIYNKDAKLVTALKEYLIEFALATERIYDNLFFNKVGDKELYNVIYNRKNLPHDNYEKSKVNEFIKNFIKSIVENKTLDDINILDEKLYTSLKLFVTKKLQLFESNTLHLHEMFILINYIMAYLNERVYDFSLKTSEYTDIASEFVYADPTAGKPGSGKYVNPSAGEYADFPPDPAPGSATSSQGSLTNIDLGLFEVDPNTYPENPIRSLSHQSPSGVKSLSGVKSPKSHHSSQDPKSPQKSLSQGQQEEEEEEKPAADE